MKGHKLAGSKRALGNAERNRRGIGIVKGQSRGNFGIAVTGTREDAQLPSPISRRLTSAACLIRTGIQNDSNLLGVAGRSPVYIPLPEGGVKGGSYWLFERNSV